MQRAQRADIVCVDGRLIVCGGWTFEDYTLSSAEQYDPSTDRWSALPSIPFPTASSLVSRKTHVW